MQIGKRRKTRSIDSQRSILGAIAGLEMAIRPIDCRDRIDCIRFISKIEGAFCNEGQWIFHLLRFGFLQFRWRTTPLPKDWRHPFHAMSLRPVSASCWTPVGPPAKIDLEQRRNALRFPSQSSQAMTEEKNPSSNPRSVRWDLVGTCMFALAALIGLSLITYDPADDLSRVFGKPTSSGTETWYSAKAFPTNTKIQNACGVVGAIVSQALLQGTGLGAYLVLFLTALAGVVCIRQRPWASPMGRSIGWTLVFVAICTLPGRFGIHPNISVPMGGGGYLGALTNLWMDRNLAHGGGVILVLSCFVGGLLLSTEYAILRYFGYAATGSMIAAKYFGVPQWSLKRHREILSGTFSPTRSDLPASLTMRTNPASISSTIAPEEIASFVESARKPYAAGNLVDATTNPTNKLDSNDTNINGTDLPASLNPSINADNVESADSKQDPNGPAIRIGRRATTSFSTADLTCTSKAIGRTDLVTPKPKPHGVGLAAASTHNADGSEDRNADGSEDSEESIEDELLETDAEYVEDDEAYEYDDEYAASDEDEEFDADLDAEEVQEEIVVEMPVAKKGRGKAGMLRADASHSPPDSGPKVKTGKKSQDDPEAEKTSLYNELNDTKLPEGTEDYVLPGVDLLTEGDDFSYDEQTEEVKRKARVLEQTFGNFGFNIRVVEIETGPVIAQYEIELEAGLRLSKITGLAEDLAIALRVPSVRIVAPIPGKNTVGIEVPNERRQVVRMREVIEEGAAQVRKMKIPLFLGKDVSGKPLSVDLASLPHLLIAGRTGTGKSVCLNSIICSILMARRPDEVRMLMIDPKMVELSGYGRLPHLMHPVVTDMRKAEAILAWAVDKMEERYSLLARAGVRHITSYNQLGREELHERLKPEDNDEAELIPDHLPFIVIVADEMADLMMTAGKEVEAHIIRLAQKSRAVGIHLILATQKPTVDVITGLIKSNLPARISFQVASRTDSRVVLDENGADKLLGNGDMLFLWPGTSTLLRGQGTYLSDDEINAIVDHCSTGEQNFVQELVQLKVAQDEDSQIKPGSFKKRDDLYEAAVDIVVREGRGSCSLLQRALGIGYGRAARLIDFMAEDGIVGEYNGSQAREVAITVTQWETMRSPAEGSEGGGGKGRSKKIRREDGWDETPKSPKQRKKSSRDVHVDREIDAFVGSADDDEEADGTLWDDE